MTPTGFALVILSALFHASWNFLLKRAGGGQIVVGMSKIAESVIFAPIFLLGFRTTLPPLATTLWLTVFAAVGVGANYVALGQAYTHGELSFVYPIARGAALVFLPVVGFVALGEHLSFGGVIALTCITAGIVALNLSAFTSEAFHALTIALRSRATAWALTAALITALYTTWDKHAVRQMAPFAYMYLYTFFVSLGYAAWLTYRHEKSVLAGTWRASRLAIVAIGALNTVSYLLVLFALRTGITSYVLGLRQLSIAAGVALGWRYLREPMSRPRATGVALIIGGCLLLSFSLRRP
ncbi:MAG: EamA family transporter [Gemmatimonadaceae bacterium]